MKNVGAYSIQLNEGRQLKHMLGTHAHKCIHLKCYIQNCWFCTVLQVGRISSPSITHLFKINLHCHHPDLTTGTKLRARSRSGGKKYMFRAQVFCSQALFQKLYGSCDLTHPASCRGQTCNIATFALHGVQDLLASVPDQCLLAGNV